MSNQVKKVCKGCGQIFYISEGHARQGRGKYCSFECMIDPRRRLFERVNKNGPFNKLLKSRCWEWTGYVNAGGYGSMGYYGRRKGVHRVSWMLHHGVIPEGFQVHHKCDNRRCVNPAHLSVGTPAANTAAMIRRGRSKAPGLKHEKHPRAKLTWDDVREIRRLYEAGEHSIRDLAGMWDISYAQTHRIVRYEQWREE